MCFWMCAGSNLLKTRPFSCLCGAVQMAKRFNHRTKSNLLIAQRKWLFPSWVFLGFTADLTQGSKGRGAIVSAGKLYRLQRLRRVHPGNRWNRGFLGERAKVHFRSHSIPSNIRLSRIKSYQIPYKDTIKSNPIPLNSMKSPSKSHQNSSPVNKQH